MKICTKCNRTYQDSSLVFCTECGSSLQVTSSTSEQHPPQTLVMGNPTGIINPPRTANTEQETTYFNSQPINASLFTQTPKTSVSDKPSNAGKFPAIICGFLTIVGIFLFFIVLIGAALQLKNELALSFFNYTLLAAIIIPAFGTMLGCFGVYLSFRSYDGQGAKKTAIVAIVFNVIYFAGVILLLMFSLIGSYIQ